MTSSSSKTAQTSFLIGNNVQLDENNLYKYDKEKHQTFLRSRKWKSTGQFFKSVKISAIALVKMVMHTKSGIPYEVMGNIQGYHIDDTIIVTDSYALPVYGTETRVSAGNEGAEYASKYHGFANKVGRQEPQVGWYHSHPGYKCWLSKIDIDTQTSYQKAGPTVAIVIDPVATMTAGKVSIGAFRTFEEGTQEIQPNSSISNMDIPADKVKEFGAHAGKYYSLDVSFFKSSADTLLFNALWDKYWVSVLSTSSLYKSAEFFNKSLHDLVVKSTLLQQNLGTHSTMLKKKSVENACQSASKLSRDYLQQMTTQYVKSSIISGNKT